MRRDSGPSLRMWATPKNQRLKLNFDGSSKRRSRRASIGGVYRDHEGRFVLGYAAGIGKATSSVAPHTNHRPAITASSSTPAPVCMSSSGIPDRRLSAPEDLRASPVVALPSASGDGILGAAPAMGIWSASSGARYPLDPFKHYTIWL